MRLPFLSIILSVSWLTFVIGQDESIPQTDTKKLIELARATVSEIRGSQTVDGQQIVLEATGPVYTYVEPARGIASGTVWVWQGEGRPAAVMSLSTIKDVRYFEFHAFSDSPLDFEVLGGRWQPRSAWSGIKIDGAPAPADSATKRLSQIKQILARFRSSEEERINGKVTPMRILPQPIFRYPNPTREKDGAVFLVSRDGDPEAVLFLETLSHADGTLGWQFMAGTLTVNLVDIFLDEKPFRLPRNLGIQEPYFILRRTAASNEK